VKAPSTNLSDGQMTYYVDSRGANPHINFEPSSVAGLKEADESYREYRPEVSGQLMKARIDRENNYGQAGDRIRTMPDWEREDLLFNFADAFKQCDKHIAERMVAHLTKCDENFGKELAANLGIDLSTLDVDSLVAVR
jgi:catalase